MKAVSLGKDTLEGRAFLVEGDDLFWTEYALRFFIGLVPPEYAELNLKIIDQLNSVDDIADATQTFSMFPADTVVIVRDTSYKPSEKEKARLLEIAGGLEEAYLIVCGKNLVSTPALKKAFTQIDASRMKPNELQAILPRLFPDIKIHPAAAYTLINFCGSDMAAISNELIKLKAYKNGGTITESDIKLMVSDNAENEIYELTNALALRNNARAYEILDRFVSRNVAYAYMLAALCGQYRRMLYAALSPLSDAELSAATGVNEYAVKKAREAASKYTKARLKDILDTLIAAEFNFKSGVMSEETAFKTAVNKLLIN